MAIVIKAAERQLNLLSALLRARDGLLWSHISRVEGYNDKLPLRSRQKRFERDLHELRSAGMVVERTLEDGAKIRYTLDRAACLMPSLALSPEQRLLLFQVGMAYLQDRGAGPLARHLSSALLKLQAGAGREGLPAVVPPNFIRRSLNRRPAESKALDAIGDALIERRRVSFIYEGRAGEAGRRTVAPYSLVTRRGGWYLVGLDTERQAVRTFRLSRVRGDVSPALPGNVVPQYEIPPEFDPESAFSTQAFGAGEHAFRDVKIHFDAEVAFIVRNDFSGVYRIEPRKDGSAVMHVPQAWPGELLRYLCEFPGHWRIEGPPALRKHVLATLREAVPRKGGA
jgi:proteasome accessory factor B